MLYWVIKHAAIREHNGRPLRRIPRGLWRGGGTGTKERVEINFTPNEVHFAMLNEEKVMETIRPT